MISIERGDTKKIGVTFNNAALIATDPDSNNAYITIYYKDGTIYLASTTMTRSGTGIYYYNWSTLSTNSIGIYIIEITATFSTTNTKVSRTPVYLVDTIVGV
jgi:hypothetical protein